MPAKACITKKQSKFKGSVREMRGAIVRALTVKDLAPSELRQIVMADERFTPALESLLSDGLVVKTGAAFHLKK